MRRRVWLGGVRRGVAGAVGGGVLLLLGSATAAVAQADPLGGLVREAIRSNLGLEQQRLLDARSEAAVRQARGLYLPSLALDARYSQTSGVLNIGDFINPAYQALNDLTRSNNFPTNVDATLPYAQETKLRLAQPLFNPAIHYNYQISRNLRDLQGAALRVATRQLAADVQLAYLNHARALRVAELYRGTLPLLHENLRVNERLLAAGRVTPDALFRARAEQSDNEQRLAQAEQQHEASARYLNLLLNRPLDAPLERVPDTLLVFPLELTLEEALLRARAEREELRQVEAGLRGAEAQGRLARAAYLPSVAVAVDYGIQGNRYEFGPDEDFVIASLVLQWNLFNGGQDAARRQQAGLEVARTRAQRSELERLIELQVRQAYEAAVVARQAIATAQDRLASARRTFELVARRYEQGAAAQFEYLDARTAFTNAELNEILTRYEYASRYVELERAAALRSLER